jgi:hypothetical protein
MNETLIISKALSYKNKLKIIKGELISKRRTNVISIHLTQVATRLKLSRAGDPNNLVGIVSKPQLPSN